MFLLFLAFFNRLTKQMKFVQQHAWASNTLKSISSEWRAFQEFCRLANIFWMPIEPWVLCFFAQWLVSSGRIKTRDSLAQYVSAVRTVHKYLEFPEIPTPSQFGPLDLILKGVRRLAMHKTKKSLPITPPILKNLLLSTLPSHFAPNAHITLHVFKQLSLIYYLTMLRSSNLIPQDIKKIDYKMIMCWENIRPLNNNISNGIVITVKKSKNNQFGAREHLVPLAAAENPLLCPVRAIMSLVDVYGKDKCFGCTPVFKVPDRTGKFVPLSRAKYDFWFKSRISNMGLDSSAFTLHAFRHGGIQETMLAEANYALCRLTSDHSSDAIMEYSFIPPERRLSISEKVNKSLAAAIDMDHVAVSARCPV